MSVSIFGVRHHGPGCARSLRAALQELQPDIVLVEGPPDAQAALPLLLFEGMQPPVALLIYVPDAPDLAVYYPFTHFSPEWQALRYALTRNIPARFIDLPQSIQLAQAKAAGEQAQKKQEARAVSPASATPPDVTPTARTSVQSLAEVVAEKETGVAVEEKTGEDPLDLLAKAAGYDDYELWWERQSS